MWRSVLEAMHPGLNMVSTAAPTKIQSGGKSSRRSHGRTKPASRIVFSKRRICDPLNLLTNESKPTTRLSKHCETTLREDGVNKKLQMLMRRARERTKTLSSSIRTSEQQFNEEWIAFQVNAGRICLEYRISRTVSGGSTAPNSSRQRPDEDWDRPDQSPSLRSETAPFWASEPASLPTISICKFQICWKFETVWNLLKVWNSLKQRRNNLQTHENENISETFQPLVELKLILNNENWWLSGPDWCPHDSCETQDFGAYINCVIIAKRFKLVQEQFAAVSSVAKSETELAKQRSNASGYKC